MPVGALTGLRPLALHNALQRALSDSEDLCVRSISPTPTLMKARTDATRAFGVTAGAPPHQPPPEGHVGLTMTGRAAKFAELVDCLMALMIALAEVGAEPFKPGGSDMPAPFCPWPSN